MATKKKKVYEEGVLNWTIKSQKWIKHKLHFIIECPFCSMRTLINVQAVAKTGQKCKKCKAKHYMSGHSARGFIPGQQMPTEQMPTDLSRTALGMPVYKDGTPLSAILQDGWSRGFDPVQTQQEAKVMGFEVSLEDIQTVWKLHDEEMIESLADNGGEPAGEIPISFDNPEGVAEFVPPEDFYHKPGVTYGTCRTLTDEEAATMKRIDEGDDI